MQSGRLVTERRFDSLSRLVEESTNGRLVRYELNDLGLPEATVYPSGFQVDRDFDALNRPQQISHDNAVIGLFQYRGPGAVEKTTYGNGLIRETSFDALTRPLSSTVGKVDLPAVFSEQTVWTPRSLKAGVARADQDSFGKVFQYDGAGRVLEVARRPAALFGLANNTVPTGDLIPARRKPRISNTTRPRTCCAAKSARTRTRPPSRPRPTPPAATAPPRSAAASSNGTRAAT